MPSAIAINQELTLQTPISSVCMTPHFYLRYRESDEVKNWLDKGFHIESAGMIYDTAHLKGGKKKVPSLGTYTSGDGSSKLLDQIHRTT